MVLTAFEPNVYRGSIRNRQTLNECFGLLASTQGMPRKIGGHRPTCRDSKHRTQARSTSLPRSLGDNGSCDVYNHFNHASTWSLQELVYAPPSLVAFALPLAARRGESGTEDADEQIATRSEEHTSELQSRQYLV